MQTTGSLRQVPFPFRQYGQFGWFQLACYYDYCCDAAIDGLSAARSSVASSQIPVQSRRNTFFFFLRKVKVIQIDYRSIEDQ